MKWKIVFGLLVVSIAAHAHQPNISTALLIEKDNNSWVVQVNSALTALQYEVQTYYEEEAYSSPEEFQQLVIDHMRGSLTIIFNNDTLTLGNAYVKLGHAASVVFELSNIPDEFDEIALKNDIFKDINRSQCALGIVKKEVSSDQYVLNAENDYAITLAIQNNQFVNNTDQEEHGSTSSIIIIGGISIFLLGLIYSKLKSTKITQQTRDFEILFV